MARALKQMCDSEVPLELHESSLIKIKANAESEQSNARHLKQKQTKARGEISVYFVTPPRLDDTLSFSRLSSIKS